MQYKGCASCQPHSTTLTTVWQKMQKKTHRVLQEQCTAVFGDAVWAAGLDESATAEGAPNCSSARLTRLGGNHEHDMSKIDAAMVSMGHEGMKA